MPIDLSEVALDPDLGSCFQILRQAPGAQGANGFVPGDTTTIQAFGVISIASDKALEQVPEGDRVKGSIKVVTNQQIFITSANPEAERTSDLIVWKGTQYRVQSVGRWIAQGFYSALAVRIAGD